MMIDREWLENLAIQVVCACYVYDLWDVVSEAEDEELTSVINGKYDCLCSCDVDWGFGSFDS